jgi:hypothetical protein
MRWPHQIEEGGNLMDTQGFVAGPLSVLCILALVMGTASAGVITATDSTANQSAVPVHHHPSPEAIVSSLEQKGIDVGEVKADLQNGDTAAAKAWLENYFRTQRPEMAKGTRHQRFDPANATQQQEIISKLEERGVDVTEVKADLQNGDTAAAKAWLENYFQTRKPETGAKNESERLQLIVNNLEGKGVDVSAVKADLQNGNIASVQAWLRSYFDADRSEMPLRHHSGRVQPVSPTLTSQ